MTFAYDDRRRETSQTAGTLGGSTDGSVRRVGRAYDSLGRLQTITSYSDTAGNTPVNQVAYGYDDFGRLSTSEQEHSGAVGMSTPAVSYAYDDTDDDGLMTANGRLDSIKYPTSREVEYGYGSSGSIDDKLSRVALLRHAGGGHMMRDLASYLHNGTSRQVEARYESASVSPEVALSRFGSTPEEYERLDRFGRIKSQVWYDGTDVLDQFDYSLDFVGNRTARDIPAGLTNGFDQLYTYDDLDRLRTYAEGTISTGSIGSPTKDADWTLDALGNWSAYEEKVSSTTTLDQTRTVNAANEITDFTNATGSAWTDPTHDAAGNMTLAPSPLDPGNSAKDQTYVWDAWNRLVEVLEGETTLATYEYDGLHRRIKKTVDGTNHHYYLSEKNQILEEQTQTGMGAAEVLNEFVWHPYYVDALAARWDDSGESGVYYHPLHDGNFNITAVINSSADVQERYHYTPYGQTTFLDGSFANPAASSGIGHENLYTGRQLDPETGLLYYRARYYHYTAGQWIARDPIGYRAGGANLFEYVSGNPVVFLDPKGQNKLPLWRRIAGPATLIGLEITWFCECSDRWWKIDSDTQGRKLTESEARCINQAIKAIVGTNPVREYGRAQSCDRSYVFECRYRAGGWPYTYDSLGCMDRTTWLPVDENSCKTCASFIELVANVAHEAQHLSEPSGLSEGESEIRATDMAIDVLTRTRDTRCEKIADAGYCKSKEECEREFETQIAQEKQVNNDWRKELGK